MKIKVFCNACKSECDVLHDMDSHQYEIGHCPFCGADITEDEREILEDDESEE